MLNIESLNFALDNRLDEFLWNIFYGFMEEFDLIISPTYISCYKHTNDENYLMAICCCPFKFHRSFIFLCPFVWFFHLFAFDCDRDWKLTGRLITHWSNEQRKNGIFMLHSLGFKKKYSQPNENSSRHETTESICLQRKFGWDRRYSKNNGQSSIERIRPKPSFDCSWGSKNR